VFFSSCETKVADSEPINGHFTVSCTADPNERRAPRTPFESRG
jgi:hypothetical protein